MEKEPRPYAERDASEARSSVEALLAEPELKLTDEELRKVRDFAVGLFEGQIDENLACSSSKSLEQIYQVSPLESEQTFYLAYFRTPNGQNDLETNGLAGSQGADLAGKLNEVEYITNNVDDKSRKQIAVNSLNWFKDELSNALAADPAEDKNYRDAETITVNYNPDKLMGKLEDLQAYRIFYRQVRRQLKEQEKGEGPSDLIRAQEVVLSLYRARVNNMIAGYYPSAVDLAEQLNRSDSDGASKKRRDRLGKAMPILRATFLQDREDRVYSLEELAGRFTRRLDFLRNGAAWQDGEEFTPISPELSVLAKELARTASELAADPEIPAEMLEKLDSTVFDAGQMKALAEDVLAEWGLLSTHQTDWNEAKKRDGFAPDGKWQVVQDPKKKGFSTDGSKRILWCPEKSDRTLTQEMPAGALLALPHELFHVLQTEYDYLLSEQVPLAKVKGRQYSTVREVGTIDQERKIQRKFGRIRPINISYLRALQLKLASGNRLEVARAFYNSAREGKQLDADKDKETRDLAADRTSRLYRYGGHNSQPLDYIEQELIRRELNDLPEGQAEAIMIACSSFSLKDVARLYRAGLIVLPTESTVSPANDVWRIFEEKYLPKINESSA